MHMYQLCRYKWIQILAIGTSIVQNDKRDSLMEYHIISFSDI